MLHAQFLQMQRTDSISSSMWRNSAESPSTAHLQGLEVQSAETTPVKVLCSHCHSLAIKAAVRVGTEGAATANTDGVDVIPGQ